MPFDDGMDELLAFTRRQIRAAGLGTPTVEVGFTSSSGEVAGEAETRSALDNLAIAVKQADQGRDPWFLGRRDKIKIARVVGDKLRELLLGRGSRAALQSMMDAVGKIIVMAYQANIDKGRSRGNSRLRKNTLQYRTWKQRHGMPGKPLQRTGQLRDALAYRTALK